MENITLCEKTVDFIINHLQERIKHLEVIEKEVTELHSKNGINKKILENQTTIIHLQLLIIKQNEKTN